MENLMSQSFHSLAQLAQSVLETRGTNAKIKLAAEYFRNLDDEQDLRLAAQFLGEGAFSDVSGKRASVGHRTIALQAAEFCEIPKSLPPTRSASIEHDHTVFSLSLFLQRRPFL